MYPELFEIPYINLTVKGYDLMLVVGFIAGFILVLYLCRNIAVYSQMLINASIVSLLSGFFGARIFYVVHHFDRYWNDLVRVFAVWEGGFELLGGGIVAVTLLFLYMLYHRLPVRHYLDILAIGLMLLLAFSRVGCFLNGGCFGKPTSFPLAVRFPYDSLVYRSQVNPNFGRNRPEPYLELPADYFSRVDEDGHFCPKQMAALKAEQVYQVTSGEYRCLAVHPTQLYSSVAGGLLCLVLYLFRRRALKGTSSKLPVGSFTKPGQTFALMLILYGIFRFGIEFLRDDSPFKFYGLTLSQNICLGMIFLGLLLMGLFQIMKPYKTIVRISSGGSEYRTLNRG